MAVMVNSANLRSRGYMVFQGGYFGMSGCVPDFWYNVGGYYLGRYVSGYLAGRGGHFVDTSAASQFPRFKDGSIRIMCSKHGVKE